MITKKTVLVLGAGASMPYEFPSGLELVQLVYEALKETRPVNPSHYDRWAPRQVEEPWRKGNRYYDEAYRQGNPLITLLLELDFGIEQIEEFRTALVGSQFNSVDAFLERRPKYVRLGKAVMAYVLLSFERKDLFATDEHWYRYLWNQMNTSWENFEKNELAIVTYNYDRSIEHYLFEAMRHSFGESVSACAQKIDAIRVVHLHGSLGVLPWQKAENEVSYGTQVGTAEDLSQMAESMIIIHEGKDDSEEYGEAFRLMSAAERIYFLGFGYGATNLKRLGIERLDAHKKIFGTAMGFSGFGIETVQRSLQHRLRLRPGLDCLNFLKEVPLD